MRNLTKQEKEYYQAYDEQNNIEPEYMLRFDHMWLSHQIEQKLKWASEEFYRKMLKGIWRGMKDRCFNLNYHNYKSYGRKGIRICQYWLVFDNFFKWSISNGYKIGKTIDRIHNDLNYCPNNCRWVSWKDNQRYRGLISRPEIGY